MKKIILALLVVSGLFALTTDQKFDLILNKLNNIDTKVNKVDSKVNTLNKRVDTIEEKVNKTEEAQKKIEVKQQTIAKNVTEVKARSCDNIKVVDFDYKPTTIGLDKGYKLGFKLKNLYKKGVKAVNIMINFRDSDDNNLLAESLIKDKLNIKPGSTQNVTDLYDSTVMGNDLAKYLATTPKKDIHLEVKPLYIKFSDGSVVRCSRW
jgi:outer membrane murein-binding lipoprotein Lpp